MTERTETGPIWEDQREQSVHEKRPKGGCSCFRPFILSVCFCRISPFIAEWRARWSTNTWRDYIDQTWVLGNQTKSFKISHRPRSKKGKPTKRREHDWNEQVPPSNKHGSGTWPRKEEELLYEQAVVLHFHDCFREGRCLFEFHWSSVR